MNDKEEEIELLKLELAKKHIKQITKNNQEKENKKCLKN